jgi:hypothetical protein
MTQDIFPSLHQEFQKRVANGLRKHFGEAAPEIDAESWEKLKQILAGYKQDAEFFRGFVNKGEVTKLRRISEKTQTLLKALDNADEAGLLVIVADALKRTPSEAAQCSLDDLRDALKTLVGNLMIEPRDEPFLKDTSREHLVERFTIWWRHSTGETPKIEEGHKDFPPPTPFMYVANEVFSLPSMPQPIGASYKSLKDHRRNIRNRNSQFKRLGEHLSKLSGSQSDDT